MVRTTWDWIEHGVTRWLSISLGYSVATSSRPNRPDILAEVRYPSLAAVAPVATASPNFPLSHQLRMIKASAH